MPAVQLNSEHEQTQPADTFKQQPTPTDHSHRAMEGHDQPGQLPFCTQLCKLLKLANQPPALQLYSTQ